MSSLIFIQNSPMQPVVQSFVDLTDNEIDLTEDEAIVEKS
jgi:hypothetical protein